MRWSQVMSPLWTLGDVQRLTSTNGASYFSQIGSSSLRMRTEWRLFLSARAGTPLRPPQSVEPSVRIRAALSSPFASRS
jgi:hypothetical protein